MVHWLCYSFFTQVIVFSCITYVKLFLVISAGNIIYNPLLEIFPHREKKYIHIPFRTLPHCAMRVDDVTTQNLLIHLKTSQEIIKENSKKKLWCVIYNQYTLSLKYRKYLRDMQILWTNSCSGLTGPDKCDTTLHWIFIAYFGTKTYMMVKTSSQRQFCWPPQQLFSW